MSEDSPGSASLPLESIDAGPEAARSRRPAALDRIRIVNAVQNTVGAYLSPTQVDEVATAIVRALQT